MATQPAPAAPSKAGRLRDAAKTCRTSDIEVPALRGISIDIPYHRFSMVVGASGSGKSTLLDLIGCIDAPTQGSVEVCGEAVGKLDDDGLADFRARNIGFIFQTFSLVPVLSAYENVEYPLLLVGAPEAERRRRTTAMLEAVALAEHAPPTARALRWPAATRSHCAGAGEGAADRTRRRAHGQPRFRDRRGDRRVHAARAGGVAHDLCLRDPRRCRMAFRSSSIPHRRVRFS